MNALFAQAQKHFDQQEYAEALKLYEQIARVQPGNAGAHQSIGSACYFLGKTDVALAAFQKAYQLNPFLAQLRVSIGDLYLLKGDLPSCFAWLNQEVQVNPQNAMAHSMLGSYFVIVNNANQRNLAFNSARYYDPKSGETRFKVGRQLQNQRQYRHATTHFVAAMYLDPNVSTPHYWAAQCYVAGGQIPMAVRCYENFLKLEPAGEWADRARQALEQLKKQP